MHVCHLICALLAFGVLAIGLCWLIIGYEGRVVDSEKTTDIEIDIEDEDLALLQQIAEDQNKTIDDVINDALRRLLETKDDDDATPGT